VVQIDRNRAKPVWHALRGGWHFNVARTGITAETPKKNHPWSDIGDAMGYGAAVLFPKTRNLGGRLLTPEQDPQYFGGDRPWRIGPETGGSPLPADGSVLGARPPGYFAGH
jgi:hypothetical protein